MNNSSRLAQNFVHFQFCIKPAFANTFAGDPLSDLKDPFLMKDHSRTAGQQAI